jgi:predicted TIM-barrel fold metal-dependent hydrolase
MPITKLERMCKKYPGLPFVYAHMAYPAIKEVFQMMEDYPDLYLDAVNVLSCLREPYNIILAGHPEGKKMPDILLEGIEKYKSRIMFGSDHPAGMDSLQNVINDLERLELSKETKKELSYETPKRFIERFMPGYNWENSLV